MLKLFPSPDHRTGLLVRLCHRTLVVGAALCITSLSSVHATGMWMPRSWIGERGEPLVAPPEFFWELEVKRIATEFLPEEKLVPAPFPEDNSDQEANASYRQTFTARTDIAEFEAALKSNSVKATDPAKALQAHKYVRQELSGVAKGDQEAAEAEEVASEFADYHNGAFAMAEADGKGYPEAKEAWEGLLKRPAEERKYRSTWAAYMLGKLALAENRYEDAAKLFQQTRALAKEGFADALGLAAESYGWEALAELQSGHAEKSARLYLTQLALGDLSAVISLKSLVPDREETLFYADESVKVMPVVAAAYGVETTQLALHKAAADPVLSRLVTAHVLAAGVDTVWDNNSNTPRLDPQRQARWLAAVGKAGLKTAPDAEYLGWVAYSMGKYDDAAKWVKLVKDATSPASLWLKAKLARRGGDIKQAATLMAEVLRSLPKSEELENSISDGEFPMPPSRSASCDLGFLQLTKGDFIHAVDTFLAVDMWDDAAYIAERVLTTKELLAYVEANFATLPKPKDPDKVTEAESSAHEVAHRFRSLVGRRLMREDRYAEARAYLPTEQLPHYDRFVAALKIGANEKAPKQDRARAYFTAAWVARHHGMELMGTDGGPDSSSTEGSFSSPNSAMERLTGQKQNAGFSDEEENEGFTPGPVKIALPVSPEEKKRLAATKLNPEKRLHYRHVAAGLAWKAAALMPDQSDETADVLNTAGNWLKSKYPKEADRFIQAIERRCYKTEIGKEVSKKHWFVNMDGPWSKAEQEKDPVEQ